MLIKFTKSYNLLKATAFMLAAVKNMYVGPAIHDASAKFCLQHNLLVYSCMSDLIFMTYIVYIILYKYNGIQQDVDKAMHTASQIFRVAHLRTFHKRIISI